MNILDLNRSDFNAAVAELSAQGVDVSGIRQQYREQSSPFSALFDYANRQQDRIAAAGRTPIAGGLLSKPEGSTGMDAVRGVEVEPMAFLSGLLSGGAQAIDAPAAAMRGDLTRDEMAAEALGAAGLAMGGGLSLSGRGALDYDPTVARIFAGPNSATANKSALEKAKRMAAKNADRDSIYSETGWFKLPDGQWRYEIDDRDVGLRPFTESKSMADDMVEQAKQIKAGIKQRNADLKEQPDLFPQTLRREHGRLSREADQLVKSASGNYGPTWNPSTLGQRATYAITDSELQRAYPDLLNRTIVRTDQPMDGYFGSYNEAMGSLNVAPESSLRNAKDPASRTPRGILLHEMQHAVQGEEGFARGSNVRNALELQRNQQELDMQRVTQQRAALFGQATPEEKYLAFQRSEARKAGDESQLAEIDSALEQMPLGRDLIAIDNEAARVSGQVIDSDSAFDAYERHLGELEARLVQARADFTPEQRRSIPPWMMSEYIPEDKQISSFETAPTRPSDVLPFSRPAISGLLSGGSK